MKEEVDAVKLEVADSCEKLFDKVESMFGCTLVFPSPHCMVRSPTFPVPLPLCMVWLAISGLQAALVQSSIDLCLDSF